MPVQLPEREQTLQEEGKPGEAAREEEWIKNLLIAQKNEKAADALTQDPAIATMTPPEKAMQIMGERLANAGSGLPVIEGMTEKEVVGLIMTTPDFEKKVATLASAMQTDSRDPKVIKLAIEHIIHEQKVTNPTPTPDAGASKPPAGDGTPEATANAELEKLNVARETFKALQPEIDAIIKSRAGAIDAYIAAQYGAEIQGLRANLLKKNGHEPTDQEYQQEMMRIYGEAASKYLAQAEVRSGMTEKEKESLDKYLAAARVIEANPDQAGEDALKLEVGDDSVTIKAKEEAKGFMRKLKEDSKYKGDILWLLGDLMHGKEQGAHAREVLPKMTNEKTIGLIALALGPLGAGVFVCIALWLLSEYRQNREAMEAAEETAETAKKIAENEAAARAKPEQANDADQAPIIAAPARPGTQVSATTSPEAQNQVPAGSGLEETTGPGDQSKLPPSPTAESSAAAVVHATSTEKVAPPA